MLQQGSWLQRLPMPESVAEMSTISRKVQFLFDPERLAAHLAEQPNPRQPAWLQTVCGSIAQRKAKAEARAHELWLVLSPPGAPHIVWKSQGCPLVVRVCSITSIKLLSGNDRAGAAKVRIRWSGSKAPLDIPCLQAPELFISTLESVIANPDAPDLSQLTEIHDSARQPSARSGQCRGHEQGSADQGPRKLPSQTGPVAKQDTSKQQLSGKQQQTAHARKGRQEAAKESTRPEHNSILGPLQRGLQTRLSSRNAGPPATTGPLACQRSAATAAPLEAGMPAQLQLQQAGDGCGHELQGCEGGQQQQQQVPGDNTLTLSGGPAAVVIVTATARGKASAEPSALQGYHSSAVKGAAGHSKGLAAGSARVAAAAQSSILPPDATLALGSMNTAAVTARIHKEASSSSLEGEGAGKGRPRWTSNAGVFQNPLYADGQVVLSLSTAAERQPGVEQHWQQPMPQQQAQSVKQLLLEQPQHQPLLRTQAGPQLDHTQPPPDTTPALIPTGSCEDAYQAAGWHGHKAHDMQQHGDGRQSVGAQPAPDLPAAKGASGLPEDQASSVVAPAILQQLQAQQQTVQQLQQQALMIASTQQQQALMLAQLQLLQSPPASPHARPDHLLDQQQLCLSTVASVMQPEAVQCPSEPCQGAGVVRPHNTSAIQRAMAGIKGTQRVIQPSILGPTQSAMEQQYTTGPRPRNSVGATAATSSCMTSLHWQPSPCETQWNRARAADKTTAGPSSSIAPGRRNRNRI